MVKNNLPDTENLNELVNNRVRKNGIVFTEEKLSVRYMLNSSLTKNMDIRHRIVALIIRNNKLLLVKGKSYPELWTPGGKSEEGESEEETLRRELKEEINLELKTMKFFRKYFMKDPYNEDSMTETKCFLVEAEGKPEPDKEIESIIWYGKENFLKKEYQMLEENEKGVIPDLIKEGLLK